MVSLVRTENGLQLHRGGEPADREMGPAVEVRELADLIGQRVFELQTKPVLTGDETMRLVGKRSRSSLDRWIEDFAPRARCGQGRFSKERILQGLRKEAGNYVDK